MTRVTPPVEVLSGLVAIAPALPSSPATISASKNSFFKPHKKEVNANQILASSSFGPEDEIGRFVQQLTYSECGFFQKQITHRAHVFPSPPKDQLTFSVTVTDQAHLNSVIKSYKVPRKFFHFSLPH